MRQVISKATVAILFVFLLVVTSFFSKPTHAQYDVCEPTGGIYDTLQDVFDLNIRRTIVNMITSALTDGATHVVTSSSSDELIGCLGHMRDQMVAAGVATGGDPLSCVNLDNCTTEADVCDALNNTYEDVRTSNSGEFLANIRNGQGRGGLIALANIAEKATYEDAPVSMQYFASRQLQRVPYMGAALAQSTVGGIEYAGPFLEITYDLWKVVRNAAFGAMAIIMIVVGVMIMTRRRLNPQTAVTVQYAIPRIVVALVLIAFSYPIGAAIASFAWVLRHSVDDLIINVAGTGTTGYFEAAVNLAGLGFVGNLIIMLGLGMVPLFGVFNLMILTIAFIFALILWVIVLIKIIFLYFRLLIGIITAPISFALGAIPGKESSTTNWFKKMIAYTLAIFAMSATIAITKIFASAILLKMIDCNAVTLTAALVLVGPLLVAFIYVFGFGMAIKMDKKVIEAVMGRQRR